MTEEKGPARPRQVTMAVVMAVVGSLVLVVSLFDTLGRLRTPTTRTAIDDFLAEPPGSSLGVDTAQIIDGARTLAFVSGALAAAGIVLAIYVMQKHRGARIGYTVVAVLLLLTMPVTGLMPFFLAVAAGLLWSQPARDWYAGRVPVAAGAPGTPPLLSQSDPFRGGPPEQAGGQPVGQPGEQPPYGQPYGQPGEQPPYGQPYGQPAPRPYDYQYGQAYGPPAQPLPAYPYPAQPGPAPSKRPATVTIAAVLTWLGAGVTALLMVAFMAVLALGGDEFIKEFDRAAQDSQVTFTSDEAIAVGWVVAVTLLVWSLSAVVLAIFAIRRSNVGRILLVVSAAMTALLSLVAITSIVSIVTLLLAGATLVLLFTGGANEWYSGRSQGPGIPTYPGSQGYQGYPDQPGMPPQYPDQPPKRNQPW